MLFAHRLESLTAPASQFQTLATMSSPLHQVNKELTSQSASPVARHARTRVTTLEDVGRRLSRSVATGGYPSDVKWLR